MNDEFSEVIEKIDLLLAERRELSAMGPHFRIVHRFREPGTDCAPGEEIAAVFLVHRGRESLVPLSTALLLLFEHLARHSRFPQSASQIAASMSADPFFKKHGANASTQDRLTRKISRSSIKEYVKRIRIALKRSFTDAQSQLESERALLSEERSSNEVGYRLKGTFEWIHVNHPGQPSI